MPQLTVQGLIDRQEISDLVSRVGTWLDDKNFDELQSIFTEDVRIQTQGGSSSGIAAVAEQARRNHEADRTQHVITNVLVQVEGDHATAQANLIATFVPSAADPAALVTHGERYRFRAVRAHCVWRLCGVDVSHVWHWASSAPHDLNDPLS
ncbi:MAG: nuclear transport factor 2 family protein [Propionibacteriales bacterium]|nr:nuclear transport factor 2 family protein [Propionibacteriales bacterium]